jgi:hypothetical protein
MSIRPAVPALVAALLLGCCPWCRGQARVVDGDLADRRRLPGLGDRQQHVRERHEHEHTTTTRRSIGTGTGTGTLLVQAKRQRGAIAYELQVTRGDPAQDEGRQQAAIVSAVHDVLVEFRAMVDALAGLCCTTHPVSPAQPGDATLSG